MKETMLISKITMACYLAGKGYKLLKVVPDKTNPKYNVFVFAFEEGIYDDMNSFHELGLLRSPDNRKDN